MALLSENGSGGQPSSTNGYRRACLHLRRADPVMAGLIARIGPCQLRPRRDHFVVLCDSILSQQLSPKAAASIFDRFLRLYPRSRPTPEALAKMRCAMLRQAGISAQKADYLIAFANEVGTGRLPLRLLVRQSNEDIVARLTLLRGIGQWTAHMFLIFALNRLDVLPDGDLGIRKAVQRAYGLESLPSSAALCRIGRAWSPYRTIASWYLWRSLLPPEVGQPPSPEG